MKNIWKQFIDDVLPSQPMNLGEVTAVYGNGQYSVGLIGGGSIRAVSDSNLSTGDKVKIVGSRIESKAPDLPIYQLEI
ncbi:MULTISPECIES: hypothetical protein [unclassified Acinetobacter]|uniref:hypothetical protein n=1 Tax=unclassified Acinetobacter TaxID=196816 RepID=UPI0015D31773|nr:MULTISPECIES: hypothetical protein [unclassified Acinetobacter]